MQVQTYVIICIILHLYIVNSYHHTRNYFFNLKKYCNTNNFNRHSRTKAVFHLLSSSSNDFSENDRKELIIKESDRSNFILNILELEKELIDIDSLDMKNLNGKWKVIHSGYGSPGLFMYQTIKALPKSFNNNIDLSEITVTISDIQPRVTAECYFKIGKTKILVENIARLEFASEEKKNILKETFTNLSINGNVIPSLNTNVINELLSRELIITYLDDDLLVIRDGLGNLEVLRKLQK